MQYKVPQNVDVEDKVIGPLTVRQFLILLVGGGVLLVLNFVLIGPLRFIFFVTASIIGTLTVALAFAKYGDQNIEVFILSAFTTFINPRKRIWEKELIEEEKKAVIPKENTKQEEVRLNIADAQSGLDQLAELVDSGGYSSLNKEEPESARDLIEESENHNRTAAFGQILEQAEKNTPKREQLVSEIASVPPDKRFEEEPHIILRNNK